MAQQTVKKRNQNFDAMKGIACIAVVFMHCEFPGVIGTLIQCLTRWSVPLFFAVSGYFFRVEEIGECRRKAENLLKITLWATAFYIIFETVFHLAAGELPVYVKQELSPVNILAFFVFNSPIFVNGHLWFLYALLYVYLACAVLIKFRCMRFKKVICVCLLILHFVLAYGFYLGGHELAGGFYRNFLFEGIPCFFIGNIFYQWSVQQTAARRERLLRTGKFMVFIGLIFSMLERLAVGRDFSMHISSLLVLLGLLFVAAWNEKQQGLSGLVWLGRKHSLFIYVIHPAIFMTVDNLWGKGLINISPAFSMLYQWIRPVTTVILSIFISVIFNNIKISIKNMENRRYE